MDTSETYIKMCEKAEKIQDSHKPEYDDYLKAIWGMKGGKPYVAVYSVLGNDPTSYGKPIWLPDQAQLQEMVISSHPDKAYQLVELLGTFREWFLSNIKLRLTSMEQLWFAFVMEEKYNKVWNGESWEVK